MPDFVTLVKELLVGEFCYTDNEVEALVNKHPDVIGRFMRMGFNHLRACCFGLEMAEEQDKA